MGEGATHVPETSRSVPGGDIVPGSLSTGSGIPASPAVA